MAAVPLPRSPTGWWWNLRQGDKLTLDDQNFFVIAGPMNAPNPERFINFGPPGPIGSPGTSAPSIDNTQPKEFLILVDGRDNDGDGYVDEAFDGIDNNGDGITDPGFNGIDDNGNGVIDEPAEMLIGMLPGPNGANGLDDDGDGFIDEPDEWLYTISGEWEPETSPLATTVNTDSEARTYKIFRRPSPSPRSRELTLPQGVVIDMTTWSVTGERSRLPVDPATGQVDILIAPNGQLVQSIAGPIEPIPPSYPFFHFWLTDIADVREPIDQTGAGVPYLLPMPDGTPGYPMANDVSDRKLEANRRLVSINTRTGQIVTTTVENFNISDIGMNPAAIDRPFLDAQAGVKEIP